MPVIVETRVDDKCQVMTLFDRDGAATTNLLRSEGEGEVEIGVDGWLKVRSV